MTMDCLELIRRCRRRSLEIYSRHRKIYLIFLLVFPFLYYLYMRMIASVKPTHGVWDDSSSLYLLDYSLENRLMMLRKRADDFSANIQHEPLNPEENKQLAMVGNGLFMVVVEHVTPLYLRRERVLTMSLSFYPIVWTEFEMMYRSAKALDYTTGRAYRVSCYMNDICVESRYYAHRTMPNIFVQDIEVINPAVYNAKVYLSRDHFDPVFWPQVESSNMKLPKNVIGQRNYSEGFNSFIGPITEDSDEFYVQIFSMQIPSFLQVKSHSKYSIQVLTAICESERNFSPEQRHQIKIQLYDNCLKNLKAALKKSPSELEEEHVNAWQEAWKTGVSISYSKAKDALNGDKINSTMYYVLSNVRSPLQEEGVDSRALGNIGNTQGCYGNIHPTFQATNLWTDLSSFFKIQQAVSYWLLTLQKQGCDHLVASGALGVSQAMVLSLGSFRFTNQHLEFNVHPKFLHRDYTFRRLQYGNVTQVNVTVRLQDDNKAIMLVALDQSDRPFYACDGGCLDGPVQLGRSKILFPVKLTEPVTAILYISPDRNHLEDLRHAIHVHEVIEAPAHDHSVVALHKHGHHLGGLPTFFWVSVCILIVIFHLFLFKLIYNEYFNSGYQEKKSFQDKHKVRYFKL